MCVILFDGVCNLCNASVNWIIDHDHDNRFRFASLQSAYGQRTIQQFHFSGEALNTLILQEGDKIYVRSEAVLRILKQTGGIYRLCWLFMLVPRFLRDACYNLIANHRYQWFGKQEQCRVPTSELKAKFLD